jgi:secreted trypsin-like serine protease
MRKTRSFVVSLALLAISLPLLSAPLIQPRIINGVESSPNAWPYMTALMSRILGVTVSGASYEASYLQGSPLQLFSGTLVDCGLASEACAGVSGNICLILRGNNTFAEKVQNCEAGGGIGAIIYNNVDGSFRGTLQNARTGIPAVGVSGEDGRQLLGAVGAFASFGYSDLIPTESFCGATWIGGVWVVTAAHCVADTEPEALVTNIGGHDLRTDQRNVINVSEILIHDGYDSDSINNDIALLRLEHAPEAVTPVALASNALLDQAIITGQSGILLGRGQQEPVAPADPAPPTPVEHVLYEVAMPLVSNEECARAIQEVLGSDQPSPVTESMVCAGRPAGDVGTCFGDSGGPMILFDGDTPYLAGITSWGIGCGQPGLYDVMTRVPYFKAEIEEAITQNERSSQPDDNFGNDTSSGKVVTSRGIGAFSPTGFALLWCLAFWPGLRKRRTGQTTKLTALVLLPALALSGCQLTAATIDHEPNSNMNKLETLQDIDINRSGVEITVISTGCTAVGDFRMALAQRQDHIELGVYRTRPDRCRRAPKPITLLLPWDDDHRFPQQKVRILNPIAAPPTSLPAR